MIGDRYSFSAWVSNSDNTPSNNPLISLKQNGIYVTAPYAVPFNTDPAQKWIQICGEFVATSLTTDLSIEAIGVAGGLSGADFGIDDISFRTLNCCKLVADAGPDVQMCTRSSVSIGGSGTTPGATYLWTPAAGLDNPASPTPNASPSVTTTYVLKVVQGNCVKMDTVIVVPQLIVNAGADRVICSAGVPSTIASVDFTTSTVLGGSPTARGGQGPGSYTYSWAPTASLTAPTTSNPVASPKSSTAYSLNVTSGDCTVPAVVRVYVQDCQCPGGVANFAWSYGIPACATCAKPINFTDLSAPSTSILSRRWDFGDGTSSTATNPSHTYATGGLHTVTLTVVSNHITVSNVGTGSGTCYSTRTLVVGAIGARKSDNGDNGEPEMAEEILSDVQIGVYPNPVSSSANIIVQLPTDDKVELNVMDIEGKIVAVIANDHFEKGSHSFLWNVSSNLAPGYYSVELKTNNSVKHVKAILK